MPLGKKLPHPQTESVGTSLVSTTESPKVRKQSNEAYRKLIRKDNLGGKPPAG